MRNAADLLHAIANDEVGWRRIGGRISYRRWTSETEYQIVTARLRSFVMSGLAVRREAGGYAGGAAPRGYVELTPLGRQMIGLP
jgi:hypothetical protein